jgi:hypothetical protein
MEFLLRLTSAEFDSLATSRGLGEDSTNNRRLLAELLLQLTIHKHQDHAGAVVVIAATNRLEDLDEAILRRFDCKAITTNLSLLICLDLCWSTQSRSSNSLDSILYARYLS